MVSSSFLAPFLFMTLLLPAISNSQTVTKQEEKQTLLRLRSDWGNPQALSSWNSTTSDYCSWIGIVCTNGFVAEISLRRQNLNKPIPAAICDLQNLTRLDLYYNNLPGVFPTVLYNCSKLQFLELSENLFVGKLPADINLLSPRLAYLGLSGNNFTGHIPSSIGQLPAIKNLQLDNNLFDGSYPAELGNLSKVEYLTLAYNPFAAARIPPEFGNMTSLKFLWMSQASVVGKIPENLANLTELELFDLSMNSVTGRIPGWVWKLEKLRNLYLYANKLCCEINGTIGALRLEEIDVSMNLLTGSMPEDLGKLRNLSLLFLYNNQLSGDIPSSIGLLPMLEIVWLRNNSLTGVLPPELGKHSTLTYLDVSSNKHVGKLPEGLCSHKALTALVVSQNNFSGLIPASLANCYTLESVQLDRNDFSGAFPTTTWSAVNLTSVTLYDNAFSGTLPGKLPQNLLNIEIQNNRFYGSIPLLPSNLVIFKASNNSLSGKIPNKYARNSLLEIMLLDENQISGTIPSEISSLKFLTVLNLSSNQLIGEIPSSIVSLPSLTTLDLSKNQLSGTIPQQLGNIAFTFLNLSVNQLSGEIPMWLQNHEYERSFLSNPGLCSSPNFAAVLHHCKDTMDGSDKLLRRLIILSVFLGGFALLSIAAFTIQKVKEYRQREKITDSELGAPKLTTFYAIDFTEQEIARGLTEDNIIGSGGSGKVYRISLGNQVEEIVAVKKIWNSRKLDAQLEKEFQAEVEILGSVRHANIVKLLCCISSSGSKLLVYEYMENESLHRWLHGQEMMVSGSSPLDWSRRLNIAIGAARGLCYMHHGCSPPIVHRDIKSSNILLDSEFRPKIADFGLARMLVKTGEPESVSAVAGSFGYMAPECGYLRKINEKVDVFSFGVVLLELTTGRRANDMGEHGGLAKWAWQQFQEDGGLIYVIDEVVQVPAYLYTVEVVLKLGLMCTGPSPSSRPSMKEVLQVLTWCDRRHRTSITANNELEIA
ncbi:receptor-like protein kinase HSL1 [Ananas comosus]|uniref:Receptor-like protein kinase HSL1 n=1 Tax=Ananas comosus TaxID=4615 RepID=A0A6P5FXK7_ANACO|nr:receptor-like protein kinase HSL1 [Ananas comosus]